jgi:hypothetical protein
MVAKSLYLHGGTVDKTAFLRWFTESERRLQAASPSAMSGISRVLVDALPIEWIVRRGSNYRHLAGTIKRLNLPLRVVEPADPEVTPTSVVLRFEDCESRDRARSHLIRKRVYPAVHWPMDATATPTISDGSISLSRRLLTLHCDARYTSADLDAVATAMSEAFS